MMLFDPEVGLSIKGGNVAGRQGGGREIMSAIVQQKNIFEECHVAPGVRPEKGYLTLKIKIANEIVCDHVWDKLSPHFCNLL
jgi:hypothetical protein